VKPQSRPGVLSADPLPLGGALRGAAPTSARSTVRMRAFRVGPAARERVRASGRAPRTSPTARSPALANRSHPLGLRRCGVDAVFRPSTSSCFPVTAARWCGPVIPRARGTVGLPRRSGANVSVERQPVEVSVEQIERPSVAIASVQLVAGAWCARHGGGSRFLPCRRCALQAVRRNGCFPAGAARGNRVARWV
jgi:hypothetical protein